MTSWNDSLNNETNWIATSGNEVVVETIDNDQNINYSLSTLDGYSIRLWNEANNIQSAWGEDAPYSVTITYAYPIGITLVFTHNVSTTTTYPTSSDMEWTDQNNIQTAWR